MRVAQMVSVSVVTMFKVKTGKPIDSLLTKQMQNRVAVPLISLCYIVCCIYCAYVLHVSF